MIERIRPYFTNYCGFRILVMKLSVSMHWLFSSLVRFGIPSCEYLTIGHDTSSHATANLIYYLIRNPKWMKKCQAEVDSVCTSRMPPVSQILKDFPLVTMAAKVFSFSAPMFDWKEALRMKGPASVVLRVLQYDVTINNLTIKKGETVLCSSLLTHFNPEYYPEPETFNPLRWSPEADPPPLGSSIFYFLLCSLR